MTPWGLGLKGIGKDFAMFVARFPDFAYNGVTAILILVTDSRDPIPTSIVHISLFPSIRLIFCTTGKPNGRREERDERGDQAKHV